MLPISTAKSGHPKAATTLKDRNFVLRAYYGIYPFFAFFCVGQNRTGQDRTDMKECSWPLPPTRPDGLWWVAFVACVVKQVRLCPTP